MIKAWIKACKRCGSALDAKETFCTDETCPFSDHMQTCTNGWYGHPEQQRPPYDCMCHALKAAQPQDVLAKSVLTVEILHPIDHNVDGLSLEQVHNECMDGDWSMTSSVTSVVHLTKKQAIAECAKQGSDPEFFGIEEEDEEEEEEAQEKQDDAVIALGEAMKVCFRAGVDPADALQEMYKQIDEEVMGEGLKEEE